MPAQPVPRSFRLPTNDRVPLRADRRAYAVAVRPLWLRAMAGVAAALMVVVFASDFLTTTALRPAPGGSALTIAPSQSQRLDSATDARASGPPAAEAPASALSAPVAPSAASESAGAGSVAGGAAQGLAGAPALRAPSERAEPESPSVGAIAPSLSDASKARQDAVSSTAPTIEANPSRSRNVSAASAQDAAAQSQALQTPGPSALRLVGFVLGAIALILLGMSFWVARRA